jgi:transposase-like protein
VHEVARELGVNEMSSGTWVRDEGRRIEAAKGTNLEPLSAVERIEFLWLRQQVSELEKDDLFLGKTAAYFAAIPPQPSRYSFHFHQSIDFEKRKILIILGFREPQSLT